MCKKIQALWQAYGAVLKKSILKANVNITYNHKQAAERDKIGSHYDVCYQG
jgi:hypothetical protein